MSWVKYQGKILRQEDKVAVDLCSCCGGACCCNRDLPDILWLKMFNVPTWDPMAMRYSSCCADGQKIMLRRCEGVEHCVDWTSGPSRWMSDADGEVWCPGTDRLWWAEMSCAIPTGGDPTSSGIILVVKVRNNVDPTDCSWGTGSTFVCDPTHEGSQFTFDAVTSTCTPFFMDIDRTGGGSPIDNDNNCCDDNTTVGSIRFEITETEPL